MNRNSKRPSHTTLKRLSRLQRRLTVERLEARRVFAGLMESSDGIWREVNPASIPASVEAKTLVRNYELFSLDASKLSQSIDEAPHEFSGATSPEIITIPTPDGGFERFTVYASPIMAPELAAKFPEIQTYAGQGIDNPAATVRFDVTPLGFHAQVLSPSGAYYVDPYASASDGLYVSYAKSDNLNPHRFEELAISQDVLQRLGGSAGGSGEDSGGALAGRSGTELRTYRTAVAATGEYTTFHGGTVALGQAAIVVAMNRVTGVYRTELSISFVLVPNNNLLVYTNAATDPYTNDNGLLMLSENQANVDRVIGNSSYDIGHVFSTGGGGIASLGSVGIDPRKAQGVTGLPAPTGDAFYIDYVAHEIGHQFGGNHTFNGIDGACGARNGSTAYEPGSGTTIQAYAGICAADDLQPNSDPYFHSISFDEIIAHVDNRIPAVGTRTATGNSVPTAAAGADFTIPASTPFVLTASGTDSNATDSLTFGWEQRDLGPAQNITAPDNGTSPLFRFWPPTADPSRTFPRLSDLVNNTTARGERLPTTNRNMNFRAVVRDNRFTGGGVNTDDMRIRVVDTGAPFAVTTPNTNVSWVGNTIQTVEWNVAGTTANGINASEVDITMSTDGGLTYPFTLATRVANDGSHDVRLPNAPTTTARIRVQASSNIFFDISNTNFTLTPAPSFILIDMGADKTYVENAPPEFLGPTTTVTLFNVSSISGATLTATLRNQRNGDRLQVVAGGDPQSSITLNGSQVLYNLTNIGSLTVVGNRLTLTMNSNASSQAAEAFLRRIAFDSTSDEPTTARRTVDVVLDAGLNGISNTEQVDIAVQTVNDAPSSTDIFAGTVAEDNRTSTGQRISAFATASFSDPDAGAQLSGLVIVGNQTPPAAGVWQYATQAAAPFTWLPIGNVSQTSGLALSAASRLRFVPAANYFGNGPRLLTRVMDETYTGTFTSDTGITSIDVSTASPTGFVSINDSSLLLTVTPVNDPPVANVPAQQVSVNEDQPLSYTALRSFFSDIDDTVLTYSLATASGSPLPTWLRFNTSTLQLTGTPSNDDVGILELRIVATDASNATAFVPLNLVVNNVNDAPISLSLDFNRVLENAPGIRVGALTSVDIDAGDQPNYSIQDVRFVIQGNILSLAPGVRLDYESSRTITLITTVTDSGSPPLSLTVPLEINVLNENEFTPVMSTSRFEISEAAAPLSPVGRVQATDGDADTTISYTLVNPSSLFNIDVSSGLISLKADVQLDRETTPSYQLLVRATDEGGKSITATVTVDLTDVNEFSPVITTTTLSTPESTLPNTVFGRLSATDQDAGQTVQFTIEQTDLPPYSLNATTGELSLLPGSRFNFELQNTYYATVRATDSGTPSRSSVATITVRITDTNDAPSGIALSPNSVKAEISGLAIGTLSVSDEDAGQQYQLQSQDSRFEVVGTTLQLKPGQAVRNTDASTIFVNITAIELNAGVTTGRSYPFQVAINRILNAKPWQNSVNMFDVDRSGTVDPLDVLSLVNAVNSGTRLSVPRPSSQLALGDFDVDGDSALTPLDVLELVNYLNSSRGNRAAEGESTSASDTSDDSLFVEAGQESSEEAWAVAFYQLEDDLYFQRRRR